MRCFIGFFGLTRSLPHTAASIHAAFYAPLRGAGIATVRAGHFNLPVQIDNPRSGERAIAPDRQESGLLDLDLCWTEPQSDADIAGEVDIAQCWPDRYGDRYRSLGNLCHQLRSLNRLWSMLEFLGTGDDDLVLLLRPDLCYLDSLSAETLSPLLGGEADLIVPAWQDWGGLNDRFAFCTRQAARIYATRLGAFAAGCEALRGMHSESFLRLVTEWHGLRVATTSLRGVRVRANGAMAQRDAGLLGGAVLPASRPAPGHARQPADAAAHRHPDAVLQ